MGSLRPAAGTLLLLGLLTSPLFAGHTERVSMAGSGAGGNGASYAAGISADGRYVAFTSLATNLVPGDTNHAQDVFLYDRQSGRTDRVSVAANYAQADGASGAPSLSADGRYVAFESVATNLVAGDTNGVTDVFVRDRQTGQLTRVSVVTGGAQATGGGSTAPSLSADGRYVVFQSDATNLVAGDTNATTDIFLHDLQTGNTTRVSVATGGAQANAFSRGARISGAGGQVAFESGATNLVTGDTNATTDIFVRDLDAGETTRVSVATGGAEADEASGAAAISADGRLVAFYSYATNLASGGASGTSQIFLRDRETEVTERVSVSSEGTPADGASTGPAISADGRYVAFASFGGNLVAGDTNGIADVFRRDCQTGETIRLSVAGDGSEAFGGGSYSPSLSGDGDCAAFESGAGNLAPAESGARPHIYLRQVSTGTTEVVGAVQTVADNHSQGAVISADGRYVAFWSLARNLVADDTNNAWDVFVSDRVNGGTDRVSVAGDGTQANGDSGTPALSADGRYVAFDSVASNLVSGDGNGVHDVFVHDRQSGFTWRASLPNGGGEGDGASQGASISADGRRIAFTSLATNLVAGDTNGVADIFVYDRDTAETTRVSVATGGTQADGASAYPAISGDGRYVAFHSLATNLVAGDTNGFHDVFVHDLETGVTERVSEATDGTQGNAASLSAALSEDGRYVAFQSDATNLVGDDGNGVTDIFVHDRQSGATERVTVPVGGAQMDDDAMSPSLSADGRYVAFRSGATNLVAGDTDGVWDVFVYDRQLGETVLASVAGDGRQGNGQSAALRLSLRGDGRVVAFDTWATTLVPGDMNGTWDVLWHDLDTGETGLVSAMDTEANGPSAEADISADGRYVVFSSSASNLVSDDTSAMTDVFVRDRQTGEVTRVSVDGEGQEADMPSQQVAISADGRYAAFASLATNLVLDDTNGANDVFVHDCLTGATERVSVAGNGAEGNAGSYTPSISAEGRSVAFESSATNLVEGTNANGHIFVHDRQTGTTELVSVASDGTQGDGASFLSAISADGRCVAFVSKATNLVAGDTNGVADIFVHDRDTGQTTRVSVASDGTQANGLSSMPAISGDGRYVAFESAADNLVADDANVSRDIFVHDRQTGETTRVNVSSEGAEAAGADSFSVAITADGRYVAFGSGAPNLVPGDTNGISDIFLHDRWTGVTTRVSVGPSGSEAQSTTGATTALPRLDATAHHVVFVSEVANLVAGDTNETIDVFVRERVEAGFSGDPLIGFAPLTTAFTDLSSADALSREWDFGDGGTSTDQDPSHQFALPGRYTVALTAFDEVDQDTELKPRYARVTFPDVPFDPEYWALQQILACVEMGIVQGYPSGLYAPATAVNRGQMAVYIARTIATPMGDAGVPDPAPGMQSFTDVATDHWAYRYIEYCFARGIVQGYPGGSYHPDEVVNRGQMSVYIARAHAGSDAGVPEDTDGATFTDVTETNDWAWCYRYVEYCAAQGIVQGYSGNLYHPEWEVTRDQMAVYVARAFDLPM